MGVTCIKTAKKPPYLNTSIPEVGKRATKTEKPSDLDRFSRMQDELEALRNEITKKNRDQLDMMYNLDMDNFSEDAQSMFKKMGNAMAGFEAYVDENEAKWTSLASWKNNTTQSIATVQGKANANEASINSLVSWKTNTVDGAIESIAGIEQKVNANEASINSIVSWKTNTADGAISSISGIEQKVNANEASINSITAWKTNTADGAISSIASIQEQADSNGARIGLLVNSAGTGLTSSAASIIVSAVNGSGSSVMINADKIQFSGEASFVTAGSLGDSGSTVVSGNRIKLHMLYETSTATSKLNFTASDTASDTWYDTLATIGLKNYGADSADDAKYALLIDSQLANENGKEYNVALKLSAKGSISIESATPDGGIYISANGFTTIEAYENVRIRASASMANMGQTGLMAFSNKDYVFCTDGIYYNGKRIVDNTQEV